MESHLQLNSNFYSIIDVLESKSLSWIFIADHRDPWRATLSWISFFFLTFAVPIFSHFVFQCYRCDDNHRRRFDWIVQVSLSVFSTLSFVSLLRFTRKYGLRRFLFLDQLDGVGDKVRRRYSEELHRSTILVCSFVLPCFIMDMIYNIWWFSSGGTQIQIPYFHNRYVSHFTACLLHMTSWLYRTSLFLLVCVLFKLTCSLQILRLQDFAQVFDKLSDVGPILIEHMIIKRNLRVISHRFRAFVLLTLVLVTASQFASLLVTTVDGSIVNVYTTGELALCSITLVFGLYICQRSAAKITHKAQSLTSLVTKWHVCATIDFFVDLGSPTERDNITPQMLNFNSENEIGDGDDELDNTNFIPVYKHTISYQQRQALVTYFENNESGITVYGFMLDRTSINTAFAIQLTLALWLLDKTIGF